MPETTALSLDSVSVLLVWTTIAVYALAFIAYAVDLARRGAASVDAKDVRERELVGARAGRADAAASVAAAERAAEAGLEARPGDRPRLVWARIGTSLTVLGFLFHVAADVTRGFAAGRVPWSNMYEFALTGTMLIVAVYLVVLLRYDLRFLGTFITGLVVVLLGGTAIWFYTDIVPLMD
ncbi:MAG TPA: c-type cytochrome biogenesis protein CcsB, partial [Agromyces sp.]